MQDTPDELRPPSLILFHGFETCPKADAELKFRTIAETKLPSRERLMTATYDMVSHYTVEQNGRMHTCSPVDKSSSSFTDLHLRN